MKTVFWTRVLYECALGLDLEASSAQFSNSENLLEVPIYRRPLSSFTSYTQVTLQYHKQKVFYFTYKTSSKVSIMFSQKLVLRLLTLTFVECRRNSRRPRPSIELSHWAVRHSQKKRITLIFRSFCEVLSLICVNAQRVVPILCQVEALLTAPTQNYGCSRITPPCPRRHFKTSKDYDSV